jgi:HEAT repeat protein
VTRAHEHSTAASSPFELIDGLGAPTGEARYASYRALVDLGPQALPAIRQALKHDDWQVRRWAAMCLDQVADAESLRALVPLLTDPHPRVRLWAVHSLACEHCKDGVRCPVDAVPLLLERIRDDENLRVRRMATIMVGTEFSDPRAIPVLEQIAESAEDRKLRAHALQGLERLRRVIA